MSICPLRLLLPNPLPALAGDEITLQEYFDSLAKTQKPASVISEEVAAQTYKQEQLERPARWPEATATSSSATADGSKQVRHCRLFFEGVLCEGTSAFIRTANPGYLVACWKVRSRRKLAGQQGAQGCRTAYCAPEGFF
jgi:hypothetical protein